MSVMPVGGPASPLYSQSRSSIRWHAWIAQASRACWYAVRPVLRLIVKAIAERQMRRAVRELRKLDDRLLRDIGLTRATIEHAVRYGREIDLAPFAAEWSPCDTQDASQTFQRKE